jgi:uncharacterized membrane protein
MSEILIKPKKFFSKAWSIFKEKWSFLYLVFFIMFAVQILASLLGSYNQDSMPEGVILLVSLASWVLNLVMSMGLIDILLKTIRGQDAEIEDLFNFKRKILSFVWANFLVGLIVVAGFILLIVPGVIWGIKYMFVQYLIVDKGLSASEAMKQSAQMTKDKKGRILVFGLFSFLINLLGLLALVLGLFITAPLTSLAYALLYNHLLSRVEPKESELAPQAE